MPKKEWWIGEFLETFTSSQLQEDTVDGVWRVNPYEMAMFIKKVQTKAVREKMKELRGKVEKLKEDPNIYLDGLDPAQRFTMVISYFAACSDILDLLDQILICKNSSNASSEAAHTA